MKLFVITHKVQRWITTIDPQTKVPVTEKKLVERHQYIHETLRVPSPAGA